ncbi:MAG: ABC transporter ATP-binding protein [Candidatus Korarchaeum sp.]|nr:ABC transporter ATP-binding protein [Candidatus Korarchaeum sp.]MDW8036177.1 ABC transporter ATP-binding protein [Candidatus Korarchaeum sp.]
MSYLSVETEDVYLTEGDDYILRTESLLKKFGELRAVDGVSIRVKRKSLTALIGPNGSGKTTLINTISGYYKPDGGRVYFKGKDITGLPPYEIYRHGLARSFQIPAAFIKLNVLENLLVACRDNPGERILGHLIKKLWAKAEEDHIERAFKILETLGIDDVWDKEAGALGAAQLKLLEVGRALMSGAELVILDEPIAGVNPSVATEIFSRLHDLRDKLGMTFFVIEHRIDIALPYSDHVFVMNEGKLIYDGDPRRVTENELVRVVYIGE